jgi:hypothetical protein
LGQNLFIRRVPVASVDQYYEKLEKAPLSNAFMLPTLVASVLRNAVGNSLRNASGNEKPFEPLSGIREMAHCKVPDHLGYGLNCTEESHPYFLLHKLARGIGYEERIQNAISADPVSVAASGRERGV